MTRQIVFLAQADMDRDSIWDHTVNEWSVQQAEHYLMGLDSVLTLLAEQPQLARERLEVDPPVRLHPYKSHIVIFRANDTTLEVLRVVHAKSNWVELLGK